ncbi:MAG TPA: hypothetical protein VIM73_23410 [Polyangiaceae bacterium]
MPARAQTAFTSWRTAALLGALALACFAAGCRCAPEAERSETKALAPLRAPSWLIDLPIEKMGAARVAVPLGAVSARPLVIALHGDNDRPEWPCGSYHGASQRRGFVLCARGVARSGSDRFTVGSVEESARELRAALPALKQRFGAHLAKGPAVLAAIGPSVEHAIEIAREEPSFFAYLILVDGSLASLTPATAVRYGRAGGRRVLFVCTRAGCDTRVESAALALRSAGVETRVERVSNGTGLDEATAALVRQQWDWLIRGDPRWR